MVDGIIRGCAGNGDQGGCHLSDPPSCNYNWAWSSGCAGVSRRAERRSNRSRRSSRILQGLAIEHAGLINFEQICFRACSAVHQIHQFLTTACAKCTGLAIEHTGLINFKQIHFKVCSAPRGVDQNHQFLTTACAKCTGNHSYVSGGSCASSKLTHEIAERPP
jgi:hypothetical protein